MTLAPHRQGDLDGLCGIYSVVNAINHLFMIRPAPGFSEHMFETVARAIPARFYPDVLWDGMDVDLLSRIARKAVASVKEDIDFDIKVSTPFSKERFKSRDDYLDALELELAKGFSVFIVFVDWPKRQGGGSHWTVLKDVRRDHLTLFDSSSQRKLPLARLGLGEGPGTRLHPDRTVMLTLKAMGGEAVA
jgi:hypothetical protein